MNLSPEARAAIVASCRRRRRDPLKRFAESYVVQPSGCWEWTGCKSTSGYGRFYTEGNRDVQAHRFSYELHRGKIPEGLQIDHLCRNRACVNPDHLEAVTSRENTLRSPINFTAVNARKTHCIHGHAFSGSNLGTYTTLRGQTQRYCKACDAARKRKKASRTTSYPMQGASI